MFEWLNWNGFCWFCVMENACVCVGNGCTHGSNWNETIILLVGGKYFEFKREGDFSLGSRII